jgi:hypothetical protein
MRVNANIVFAAKSESETEEKAGRRAPYHCAWWLTRNFKVACTWFAHPGLAITAPYTLPEKYFAAIQI